MAVHTRPAGFSAPRLRTSSLGPIRTQVTPTVYPVRYAPVRTGFLRLIRQRVNTFYSCISLRKAALLRTHQFGRLLYMLCSPVLSASTFLIPLRNGRTSALLYLYTRIEHVFL